MKRLIRISLLSAIVCLVSLFSAVPALAIPTMPSSFYGKVKVNDANVANGTRVQALINGQVYAEALAQAYQGDSVYTVDVRGDDTDTPAVDGGREGDTVQFKIGGVLADQTGIWHSGTNVVLNLTASSSKTLTAPKVTRTPIPTQTPVVVLVQPSPTPTVQPEPTSAPTATLQSLPASQKPAPSSSGPSEAVQAQPTAESGTNADGDRSSSADLILVAIALIVFVAAGGFWVVRRKM